MHYIIYLSKCTIWRFLNKNSIRGENHILSLYIIFILKHRKLAIYYFKKRSSGRGKNFPHYPNKEKLGRFFNRSIAWSLFGFLRLLWRLRMEISAFSSGFRPPLLPHHAWPILLHYSLVCWVGSYMVHKSNVKNFQKYLQILKIPLFFLHS